MKKIVNKQFFYIAGILTLFLTLCTKSYAAYCNSPCPDPCSPSRTVCEGSNCTTYCNSSPTIRHNAVYYTNPGVSFSYSTPNVSFSISNEVYGVHNYYSRPNFVISSGFRPVYHRYPLKPAPNFHKHPAPKPRPGVHNPSRPPHKAPAGKPIYRK